LIGALGGLGLETPDGLLDDVTDHRESGVDAAFAYEPDRSAGVDGDSVHPRYAGLQACLHWFSPRRAAIAGIPATLLNMLYPPQIDIVQAN
jgi:hypothetical protein